MVTVTLSCPVFPSEDPKKVRDAVGRIFPGEELAEEDGLISGPVSLDNFSKMIRRQQILDTTRSVLFKGLRGDRTVIRLNKQVATVGKVSFAEPRPVLGAIEISIEGDDLESFIDRLAPATVDGKEVLR